MDEVDRLAEMERQRRVREAEQKVCQPINLLLFMQRLTLLQVL